MSRVPTRNAVFVAPFFLETTLRFVESAASLEGVRLALVSQDPLERLPRGLRHALAAYRRVADGMDPQQLTSAVRSIGGEIGPIHKLIGALEQLQEPLGEVREALAIEGMDRVTARGFRDKSLMKDILRKAGIPCARHALAHDAEEALRRAPDVGFPMVVKPPDGAGARNTLKLDGRDDLLAYLKQTPPRAEQPLLMEEFITGREHSFDAISIKGRAVWHSLTHYFPAPLEVMENPWIQWCVLLPREVDHPRYDDIRRAAAGALDALGMDTGLSHMEWFRRRDGSLAISEVGARPPGAQFTTLMSYAHDVDFYKAWARLMIFDTFDPPRRAFAAGAAFIRGQGQGRVQAIHGLEKAQRELGELVVEARLPKKGQSPSSSYEGDGYVILRHPKTEVVEKALERLVTLIRVELG